MRIALIHPDLGIGGAERLVVDAALGLQKLGHTVDIYTSYHDHNHCFEETRDGTLNVHHISPPFPRSFNGKFHILFAHLRQLHLTKHLLSSSGPTHDIFFVDQLSTCIPFLRIFSKRRVVFYCHFPDKLLADGEFVDGQVRKRKGGLLKRLYRLPMDVLEELTTGQADVVLANSRFTARVFNSHFSSISITPKVIHPGINISAYERALDFSDSDIATILSDRPTLLSLNRFEKKKNAMLAITAFATLKKKLSTTPSNNLFKMRLVLAGGHDPRLEDNIQTLSSLFTAAESYNLTYTVATSSSASQTLIQLPTFPTPSANPDILFLLNFTTPQRSALLTAKSTLVLLYTPTNEHFGIGPVEGMICGVPVLACNTGGPTESVVTEPASQRTGWLCPPDVHSWAEALEEIVQLSPDEREALATRSKERARRFFGMEAMAKELEKALMEANEMGPVQGVSIFMWIAVLILVVMVLLRFLF